MENPHTQKLPCERSKLVDKRVDYYVTVVLLQNCGFCNGCITKRTLLLQAFHSLKTYILQIMTKKITILIYLIVYHREIVKLDNFMTLSLSYATTFL